MLSEKTALIIHFSKSIKNNFKEIGKLLKEIKENEIYKEKYPSFEDYLDKEGFDFSRQYAYKMIDVYNLHVKSFDSLSISHLIQLTYVSDKEIREELIKKTVKEELTVSELKEEVNSIKRFSQNITEAVGKEDDPKLKVERIGRELLTKISAFKRQMKLDLEDLKIGIDKFIKFSQKYPESKEIDILRACVLKEWQELRK